MILHGKHCHHYQVQDRAMELRLQGVEAAADPTAALIPEGTCHGEPPMSP